MSVEPTDRRDHPELERRSLPREDTRRRALFSPSGSADMLADGMVVDISPNGLQVRTHAPLAVGDPIEIEVFPRAKTERSNVILVRGRVVRVTREGGEWAMGVQLARQGPVAPPAEDLSKNAQAIIAQVSRRLHERRREDPSPLAFSEHALGEAEVPVTFRKRRDRRWLLALLLLLALLGLTTVMWRTLIPANRGATREMVHERVVAIPTNRPPQADPQDDGTPSTDPGGLGGDSVTPRMARANPAFAPALSEALGLLMAGKMAESHDALERLATHPDADPLTVFVANTGRIWTLAALGETPEATILANHMLAEPEAGTPGSTIPEPWIKSVEELRRGLADPEATWRPPGFLVDALVVGDEAVAPEEDPASGGDTRIEVDAASYTLTVYRGALPLGRFPVGLGQGGSTPEGDFSLVNKLRNPDWYNRGDVVPAGDPRNPLGGFWMGLADEGKPIPVGIHPTRETDSIGANESRGCIRMRPGDAARVFRWCEVGTPVHIAR